MIRIALIGSAGRMGQAIIGIAESERTEVVAKIDLGGELAYALAGALGPPAATPRCAEGCPRFSALDGIRPDGLFAGSD